MAKHSTGFLANSVENLQVCLSHQTIHLHCCYCASKLNEFINISLNRKYRSTEFGVIISKQFAISDNVILTYTQFE